MLSVLKKLITVNWEEASDSDIKDLLSEAAELDD